MVSTRSSTAAKQSHLDDFTTTTTTTSNDKDSDPSPALAVSNTERADSPQHKAASKKRFSSSLLSPPRAKKQRTASSSSAVAAPEAKHEADESPSKSAGKGRNNNVKRIKEGQEEKVEEQQHEEDDVVYVNRSPVLTLWAACVTRFLHPNLSWDTCLSAGSAIAALCATAKGRSIGVYDPAHKDSQDKKQKDSQRDGHDEIHVMGFTLALVDGVVVLGAKDRKKLNEGLLKDKFGLRDYARVKETFDRELETWKGDGNHLNSLAFAMYESFRPDVVVGRQGWGRKGALSLLKIGETVTKG